MSTQELFNVERARSAFQKVLNDAEELFAKFEQNHKNKQDNFDQNGAKDIALGGALANNALSHHEEMVTTPFNEFKAAFSVFNSKLDTIMTRNSALEDEARSIYSA